MSGQKKSDYELQRERQERLELYGNVQDAQSRLQGMRAHLQSSLQSVSAGLRNTFPEEVKRVEGFLTSVRMDLADGLNADTAAGRLRQSLEQINRQIQEATTVHKNLAVTFGEKADKLGRELSERLADTTRTLAEGRELLGLWVSATEIDGWETDLRTAHSQLAQEQYRELAGLLDTVTAQLAERTQWSQQQEEKHRKRRYVVKAIRSVCESRGFQLVGSPAFEDENNRGSAVVMTFDTLAKGVIEFSLTLDEIHANSAITQSSCFDDFDALSDSLEELYGVETEFKYAADNTRPEGRRAKGIGQRSRGRTLTQPQQRRT
jgi:C4-type Zn-finger protein